MEYENNKKLSLDEAFKTLKTMFKTMDDDVILTVLESNSFEIEATIDCLLNLQNSTESEKSQKEISQNNDNADINNNQQPTIQQNIKQNDIPKSNSQINIDSDKNAEKVLSLFQNIDPEYDNNYQQDDNFNPYNMDFETLQAYCLENNIPLNDLDLIKFYMDNPEELYQIEPVTNTDSVNDKKIESNKKSLKKPSNISNIIKNDKNKGNISKEKKLTENHDIDINEKEDKIDEKHKKKKGFGQKFKGIIGSKLDWFNDIFSKKKKEDIKRNDYEAISGNDDSENIKNHKK